MNRSPLHSLWQSLGAVFTEEEGWQVPLYFKSPDEDDSTLQSGNVILDFSSCGKIKVTGNDRVEFLHNILTNDIKKLSAGQHCLAALLHANGKTLSFMEVHIFIDHILLLMEAGSEGKTLALLDKYIIADDVQLKNITSQYAFVYWVQPAEEMAGRLESELFLPYTDAFLLKKDVAPVFVEKLIGEKGAKPEGYAAYEILRIENGVLRYLKDFDDTVILSETGLDPVAVSATKGCYPGQEVIAKIETYDGLQRKIALVSFTEKIQPPLKTKIVSPEGKEIGEMRSTVWSERLQKSLGFCYLSKRYPENANFFLGIKKPVLLKRENPPA